MKHFKKMMALIIALVMVVGTMSTMSTAAAGLTADPEISITGLDKGDEVKLYKVLEWSDGVGWVPAEGFADLIDSTKTNYSSKIKDITDNKKNIQIGEPDVVKIANLAKSANAVDTATIGDDKTYTYVTHNQTADRPGMYVALVTAATAGTVYNPIVISADFSNKNISSIPSSSTIYGTSVAKKTTFKVFKTTKDSDSAIAQAIDSYVGQTVDFFVDTTIPVYLDQGATNVSFVIKDEVETNGVELLPATVKVTVGKAPNQQVYTQDTADVLTIVKDGTKGYTVTFLKAYLDQLNVATPVQVSYQGKITNKAEFNINEDDNEVTVTYKNGDDETAARDRTNHYTFSIGADLFGEGEGKTYELIKVGVDSEGKPVLSPIKASGWKEERHPLSGAKFGLFTKSTCTDADRYKEGQYADTNKYPKGAEFTTGDDGVISFYGLAAGKYYVKELEAPKGYIKDDRVTEVIIQATYKEVHVDDTVENGVKIAGYDVEVLDKYTVSVNGVSVYDSSKETYGAIETSVVSTYTYENNRPTISASATDIHDGDKINTEGVELPSTGGIGTTIFYVIGAILVLGAGVLLVTRRRMNEE